MDIVIFFITTLVAVLASLYLFGLSQVDHIKKNWVKYRCNPIYMPMAGMVGDNIVSNFTKCTMKSFHDYTGFVMDPIMAEFSVVSDTIGEIGGALHSMRSMFSGIRGGFLGIVGSVFGKIHNVMAQTQYIVIRMRTLMSRVVGIMFSFIYIFYAGMESGQSLMNGPVGKTMSFLCFDENTSIPTVLGQKPIKNIEIGDMLTNFSVVTSLYKLDGKGVAMYRMGNCIVSGNHKVRYKNKYIRVDKHPHAKYYEPGSKNLVCLNTTNHKIPSDGYEFLDFVETENRDFLKFKSSYIQTLYNGYATYRPFFNKTGVLENTKIPLQNGIAKYIQAVNVGDVLDNGDVVKGVCKHFIRDIHYTQIEKDILVSPSTWVFENNKIHRACALGHTATDFEHNKLYFVYQLITDSSMFPVTNAKGDRLYVLDELETTEQFFHNLKDSIITSGTFRGKEIVV